LIASTYRHAYLHGFGSSRLSRKGVFLRDELARDGIELELLDLNVPSFGRQTYTDILASIDAFDATTAEGVKLRVMGSSMGGYLAARWAELNPERVDRLFLLCPGFDLAFRWPTLLGAGAMARWEAAGMLEVANGSGLERPLHWRFVEDSREHPAFPEVPCRTRILHGTRDAIVPIGLSRGYVRDRPHVDLVEVDDEHPLGESLERIAREVRAFFDLGAAT
jgi:pimeloyl-ACP methyl ester carboxylesterase